MIAEKLHVHPSTITREINRNGYSRYHNYKPAIAQQRAEFRWRNRKLPRRFKEEEKKLARELLEKDYSPDQIVGYCRRKGIKMVSHETLYQWIWWDKRHGGDLYFAHPYHSWERGSNENTNGLARQYIPKGSDFDDITDEFLEQVEVILNSRPRRRYDYKTPDEMFRHLTGLDGLCYV